MVTRKKGYFCSIEVKGFVFAMNIADRGWSGL